MSEPSKEAVEAANKCCDWIETMDDQCLPEEREKCAEFIQSAIDKSRATQPQETATSEPQPDKPSGFERALKAEHELEYYRDQEKKIFDVIEELKITEPEGSMLGRVTSICDALKRQKSAHPKEWTSLK